MNKIFKVIWNHTTQSWVAVSELTSAKGKTKSKTAAKLTALSLVAGSALMAGNAMAADATITSAAVSPSTAGIAITANGISSVSANNRGTTDPINVIYIGNNQTPTGIGDEDIMIGYHMTGNSAGHAADTLIGNRIRSGGGGNDSLATAVGYAAQVSGPSVSIGVGSSTDIGDANGPSAVAQGAVGIGAFARTSGSANGGVAVGALTSADQTNSTAIGTLAGVTTLGYDRTVTAGGNGGVLLRLSEANGDTLTSIGSHAGARTTGGIAVGSNATTSRISSNNAIAMGTNSAAVKANSIAIGNEALGGAYKQSDDFNTLRSQQSSYQTITNTQRTRLLQVLAAANANPSAENKFQLASALGYLDRAQLAVNRATVDITQAVANVESSNPVETTNAMAIGNQARAVSTNAMAAGYGAIARGSNSTATGVNAQAMGPGAIASGNGAIAGMTEAAATTYQAYTTAARAYTAAANTLAAATENYNYTLGNLGTAATTALITDNVDVNDFAAVAATTDSNLAGLRTAANRVIAAQTALDTARETFNTTRTAANNVASSNNAVAIGTSTVAAASGSVAIGNNAEAPLTGTSNAGVAVGDNSRAGDGGTAVGQRAEAVVSNTVAIGVAAKAGSRNDYNAANVNGGYGAIAIGYNTYAKDGGTIAIGSEASGRSANAHGLYAMAIGAGSAVGSFNTDGSLITPDPGTINTASNNSMAVGYIARVDDAVAATAVGPTAVINKNATYGVALGAATIGKNAIGGVAIGAGAQVVGNDSESAMTSRGVALGARSQVTDGIRTGFNPAAQQTTDSYTGGFANNENTATETFTPTDTRLNQYAGLTGKALKSTIAPVSVGSASHTRQINHVAAGYADDDAVNVAQLRSVNLKIAGNTVANAAPTNGVASKADVLLDSQTLSVISDNTDLLTTDATNNTITITPKTGTVSAVTTGDNAGSVEVSTNGTGLMTAAGVASAINASYWKATSSASTDGEVSGTTVQAIHPGDTVTYDAGKNIKITQDQGKFTFATKDDVAFNTVALGNQTGDTYTATINGNTVPVYKVGEDADGNPIYNTAIDGTGDTVAAANVTTTTGSNPINMTTKAATPATNNNNAPTNALDITSANGTPTQITGVASTLNSSPVATSPNGTTTAVADQPKLVDLNGTSTNPVNPNAAATVGDLQNMGWVVSSNKTTDTTGEYKDVVKNANEVRFIGTGLANVSGLTGTDGVRTITVNVDAQSTVESAQNPVVYTNAAGDKLTKVGNNFYPATSVVNNGVAYPEGTVIINGNAYVAGTTEDQVNDGTATAATPATAVANGDVIASMNDGNNSSKNTPMALSNVAAGAKTFAAPVDANGNDLKLANDGLWYPAAQVSDRGVPADGATAVRPTGTSVGEAKGGLIDFANSNPTNALTVADAQNMGWVVAAQKSVDGTTPEYADQVRNANEVRFVGANGTSVYGRTTAAGVREIVIDTVKATQPDDAVVYSYTDPDTGNTIRIYPQDVPVINEDGTVARNPDGTVQTTPGYSTTPYNTQGVQADDITPEQIAAIVNQNNYPNITTSTKNPDGSVTTPTSLTNIANNLPTVTDTAGSEAAADKKGNALTPRTDNGATNAAQQAPITAATAADLLDPKRDANGNITNPNYVGNRAATVSDVLNAGWNLQGNGSAVDFVKPYDTVNFVDGGNTSVVATVDAAHQVSKVQVNVTGLPITYTDADGDVVAKVGDTFYKVDGNGNPTTEAANGNISTNLVNPNDAGSNTAGNATQLGNVAAGANTIAYDADGNPLVNIDGTYYSPSDVTDGKPNDGATAKTAVTPDAATKPVEAAKTGLADLDNSNETNALTVADAKNLGWVVEASNTGSDGKDATNYAGAVKNSNEVRFNGSNGITVTGKTGDNGEHIIDIALAKGTVVSTDQAGKTGTTTDAAGNTVNVIKIGDNWYNAGDVTTDENGNNIAKEGATPITTNVTANTSGSGFVTGNQVGDAIEQSGWNLGKATDATMQAATGTGLTAENGNVEKVNPNDNVRYVDGTNITQTLKTVTETNADGTTHTTTYIKADLNPQVTLGGKEANADGSLTVNDKDGNTGVSIAANNGAGTVNINGSDGSKAAIGVVKAPTNLANMPAGAVNVDGKWYNPSDVTTTTDAAGNTTTTVNAGATPISATMDRIQYTDANGTPHQVATMEDGLKFRGDDGQSISKPLNSTVDLTGGNRTTTNADGSTTSAPVAKAATTTGNIGVFNDNGKMSVQLAKDLQGMNSATFGGDNNSAQTVINGNGVTVNPAGNTDPANAVSVTTNGVNAGNQRVTNVAPGRIAADSKDAVNGSQLYGVAQNVNNLGNKINRMDKNLRAGVAGANAAAGLPQVYLPGKSMVAASAGTFKGQNAVAIGYSRASDNGKVIFKLQGNANSQGDVGGSVGVGYQW